MQENNSTPNRAAGGFARAEKLSKEELSESGRNAALARWGGRPLKAIHKGNFIDQFGIDVECYVLDDASRTAVISQRGMGKALGMASSSGSSGQAFPRFLASKLMSDFGGAELGEKFAQPLKFEWASPGVERPPGIIHGFDVTLLVDVCNAIIAAEAKGRLGERYAGVARQAHIINGACAKSGIKILVYALAGYNPTAEEVINAFKSYVQEEAKKYEKEFPDELYEQWQRLYDLKMPERGKPWQFKHLTVNHIYYPLAKSNGKLLTLLRGMKAAGGKQSDKLFQFLNEVGARALRMHMGRILEICETSPSKAAYEKRIEDRFGNGQLDLFR